MNTWFREHADDVLHQQNVELERGLSDSEAIDRLEKYGHNELEAAKKINPIALFFGQFKDVLVIILLVAALVSWGVGVVGQNTGSEAITDAEISQSTNGLTREQVINRCDTDPTYDSGLCGSVAAHEEESEGGQEALLILAIVVAIAMIGFFNEYKAEKTVEALRKLVGSKATVRRGGQVIEIDAADVVPGDIVVLEEGQKIPADIRLVQVRSLQINEASLTGESLPVTKHEQLIKQDASLGDQKNMVFAGTFVTQGTAEGVVVETAQGTELGKIASLVNDVEAEVTPMQRKLDELGKRLGLMILVICAVVFLIVVLLVDEARDKDMLQRLIFAFTAAVALAVAAIPEGLAFVVRISLALGARRMASKNGLVRKLSAVEALGSTDVICSDKTGTLTKGEMTVREIVAAGSMVQVGGRGYSKNGDFTVGGKNSKLSKAHEQLLLIGALCNNSRWKEDSVFGDPTEGALLVSAFKNKYDYEKLQKSMKRVDEVPFTSDRKFMSTVHQAKTGYIVAAKGSIESTMERCNKRLNAAGKVVAMTAKDRAEIMAINKDLSSKALRVLAFAQKELKAQPKNAKEIEKDLVYIGLQAMMDPPREEVVQVIHRVQSEAGMRVVMITGDYIETAKAVATEIGIQGEAISGVELEAMTQSEFEEKVESISVYARVNPEHKIRIVKALKAHGHQVAMTGDGVNDAPAIKAADIGIAMGINGTDAAKEAADLILLDDKFVTIINAIEEGRGIFDNVRKFVNFLISCNIAEVLVILFGILFFNNLLLTAAQLLFINIVTDGLPAVALGSDPSRSDVLKAKPARFQESILTKRVWVEIFVFGALMTIVMLVQYWYNLDRVGTAGAVSAAFTAMVVYELVRLVDIRTDYKIKWLSNPMLTVAMLISLALQFSVLYVPAFANYFNVGPLAAHDWTFMIVGSILLFVAMKLVNPVLDRLIQPEISTA
ncbi:MAG: Ca2+-transporting ATPase [Candidatus Saccharimonadales bacterium]|jgi:Ca2+-transporting ATPase